MSESNKCAVCETECGGVCCSGKCRAKLQRTRTDNERTDKQRTVELAHAERIVNEEGESGVAVKTKLMAEAGLLHDPNRPPCTADQLTSPCHACKDVESCEYKRSMNSAKPGDADYKGVCVEAGGTWEVGA